MEISKPLKPPEKMSRKSLKFGPNFGVQSMNGARHVLTCFESTFGTVVHTHSAHSALHLLSASLFGVRKALYPFLEREG